MAAAVVAAIITQLNQQVTMGAPVGNFFSFITGSNIIGVIALTTAALAGQGLFLVHPIGHLADSMIRGPIVDWYPYPLLDPRINGYTFVAVIALALAWLLCWSSRRDFGRSTQDAGSRAVPSR